MRGGAGPLSQSWTLEMLGYPHCSPLQPENPSMRNAQSPEEESDTTMRPSSFLTSTPNVAVEDGVEVLVVGPDVRVVEAEGHRVLGILE